MLSSSRINIDSCRPYCKACLDGAKLDGGGRWDRAAAGAAGVVLELGTDGRRPLMFSMLIEGEIDTADSGTSGRTAGLATVVLGMTFSILPLLTTILDTLLARILLLLRGVASTSVFAGGDGAV